MTDEKQYTTKGGLVATLKEHEEMLDTFKLEEIQIFYFSEYTKELRTLLRPYMLKRIGERQSKKK